VDPMATSDWTEPSPLHSKMLRRGVLLSRRGGWLARLAVVRFALSLLAAGGRRLPKLIARAGRRRRTRTEHLRRSHRPNITAEQLEKRYCDLVRTVRENVRIPIAVKLSPYFTSCANFASKLSEAGADGIVIFNRFYQPDFDLEELEVVPNLVLSSPHELRLRLHWAAILYHQVETYIAITGGVHDSIDVLKSMMAAAHVAMMTSALLKYGIEHIGVVLAGMEAWMAEHEYVSPDLFCIFCAEGDSVLARDKAGGDIPDKRTARVGYDCEEEVGANSVSRRELGFPGGIQLCGGYIRAAHALGDRGATLRRMALGLKSLHRLGGG